MYDTAMKTGKGFTLIELMIVVAIIAIIAAIAIPSLLSARMAANETSAVACLRALTSAQSSFRQTDADGNGWSDYWTGDVAGLYAMESVSGDRLKYIDVGFANADDSALVIYAAGINPWAAVVNGGAGKPDARAGYYYHVLRMDETGQPYQMDSDGDGDFYTNRSRYGFEAYPGRYGVLGRRVFIIDEAGVVFGVDGGKAANGTGNSVGVWPPGVSDPTQAPHPVSGRHWSTVGE